MISFWQQTIAAVTRIQAAERGRGARRCITTLRATPVPSGKQPSEGGASGVWEAVSSYPSPAVRSPSTPPNAHLGTVPYLGAVHASAPTALQPSHHHHSVSMETHMGVNNYAQRLMGPEETTQLHGTLLQPPPPPPPPTVPHQHMCFAPPPIQTSFHPPSPLFVQRSMSDGSELASPRTAYHSRVQPRMREVEPQQLSAHPFTPYHSAPAAPDQQHERLLTAIVIDRFCSWGEHRSAQDWPAELVNPGPIPSLVDALLSSRTRTLTLPQLITAIKERTGGGSCGKALDMLNLKAYVRCFPTLFVLHSGRTSAGRPLDAVELRAVDAAGMLHQHAGAVHGLYGCHGMAASFAASAWSAQSLRPPMASMAPSAAPAISPPLMPQPCGNVPASCANQPRATLAYDRLNPMSPLQPKDLFGAAGMATGYNAPPNGDRGSMPGHEASWARPDALNFPLFACSDSSNVRSIPPEANAHSSQRSSFGNSEQQPIILAQLNELFGAPAMDRQAAPPAHTPLCVFAAPASADADARTARRAFVRRFELDRLFDDAVDRAMQHNVASPVHFIAQELLRMAPVTRCV